MYVDLITLVTEHMHMKVQQSVLMLTSSITPLPQLVKMTLTLIKN